jgi:hypothetical protein
VPVSRAAGALGALGVGAAVRPAPRAVVSGVRDAVSVLRGAARPVSLRDAWAGGRGPACAGFRRGVTGDVSGCALSGGVAAVPGWPAVSVAEAVSAPAAVPPLEPTFGAGAAESHSALAPASTSAPSLPPGVRSQPVAPVMAAASAAPISPSLPLNMTTLRSWI